MGKVSLILLVVSILSIIDSFSTESTVKTVFSVLGGVVSLYATALDLYVFLINPYSFKTKLLDIVLRTFLGEIYDENKVRWSLKGWGIYCSQLASSELYKRDGGYFAISRPDVYWDKRDFHNESIKKYDVLSDTAYEKFYFYLSIRSSELWQDETDWIKIEGFDSSEKSFKGVALKNIGLGRGNFARHFKHGKVEIMVLFSLTEGLSFDYTIRIIERQVEVDKITGKTEGLENVYKILHSFEVISRDPADGIMSLEVGGRVKNNKYLHCYKIREFVDLICTHNYELYYLVHLTGGFCVAGGCVGLITGQEKIILRRHIDEKLNSEFFENSYLEEKVKRYIDDRYKKKGKTVLDEYIKNPHIKKFSKEVLNGWQIRRLFSDISNIMLCVRGVKSRLSGGGVNPTRSCNKIIMEIIEEKMESKGQTPYKISKMEIDDLKKDAGDVKETIRGSCSILKFKHPEIIQYEDANTIDKKIKKFKAKLKTERAKILNLDRSAPYIDTKREDRDKFIKKAEEILYKVKPNYASAKSRKEEKAKEADKELNSKKTHTDFAKFKEKIESRIISRVICKEISYCAGMYLSGEMRINDPIREEEWREPKKVFHTIKKEHKDFPLIVENVFSNLSMEEITEDEISSAFKMISFRDATKEKMIKRAERAICRSGEGGTSGFKSKNKRDKMVKMNEVDKDKIERKCRVKIRRMSKKSDFKKEKFFTSIIEEKTLGIEAKKKICSLKLKIRDFFKGVKKIEIYDLEGKGVWKEKSLKKSFNAACENVLLIEKEIFGESKLKYSNKNKS